MLNITTMRRTPLRLHGHAIRMSSTTAPRAVAWLRTDSLSLILALLALATPVIAAAWAPLFGDIWWVLAYGKVIIREGGLPSAEPFTFAVHAPEYIDAQWLAQLAYYVPYLTAGLSGVAMFNIAVVAVSAALLLQAALNRTSNLAAAALSLLLVDVVALWRLAPRAQALACVGFIASYRLLSQTRPGVWPLVGLAIVQAIWANVHGSFFLGPVLTVVLLVGVVFDALPHSTYRSILLSPRVRFLTAALVVQVLAALINPYGAGMYEYALRLSTNSFIRDGITEWQPTNLGQPVGMWFFASLALTVGVLGRTRRPLAPGDLLMLAVFAALGLQAVRNAMWWGLVSGPILAPYIAELRVPRQLAALCRSNASMRGNVLRSLAVAACVLACLPVFRPYNPLLPNQSRNLVPADQPAAAATFLLEQHLPWRVFSYHSWSGYLDWRLAPRYQQMVDVAIEAHPPEVWRDYLSINAGHISWEERLRDNGVDVLFLSPTAQSPLLEAVSRSPEWQPIYSDDVAVIYTRSTLPMEAHL